MRRKTIIIGLDGVRPDALAAASTPHIDALIAGGAYTPTAQTCAITVSGPAWTSLLTGVEPEKHGVVDNSFDGARYDRYPTVFDRVRAHIPHARTASVVNWGPINDSIIREADTLISVKPDELVADAVVELLHDDDPDLVFVQLDQPDAAGHSHTYSPESPGYLRQLSETDGHVGRIVGAVRNRPTYADEDWLVIVTTDHGGSERGHGKDIPEHRTVFVLLEGPSVQAGSLDGGVNIADVGVTALVHLGVPVEPSWEMDGRVVALTAS